MLILLRHGRTTANRDGLLQGRVDNPLDEHGQRQAETAAAYLHASTPKGIDRVIASPLIRAQQTAQALGLSVETEDRFMEINYGEWEEKPVAEVTPQTWSSWRADPNFRPPGGETLIELGTRVREAVAEIATEAEHSNIVLVSHVSPMKAMIAWALGVSDEATWRMYIAQASICRIDVRRGTPVLTALNEHAV